MGFHWCCHLEDSVFAVLGEPLLSLFNFLRKRKKHELIIHLTPLYFTVQTISDLEAQLSSLREEVQQAHVHHKKQVAEMALLQEEEKQRAFLDKEASLEQLRSDMEKMYSDLQKSHQQEKDATCEKVSTGHHRSMCVSNTTKLNVF